MLCPKLLRSHLRFTKSFASVFCSFSRYRAYWKSRFKRWASSHRTACASLRFMDPLSSTQSWIPTLEHSSLGCLPYDCRASRSSLYASESCCISSSHRFSTLRELHFCRGPGAYLWYLTWRLSLIQPYRSELLSKWWPVLWHPWILRLHELRPSVLSVTFSNFSGNVRCAVFWELRFYHWQYLFFWV